MRAPDLVSLAAGLALALVPGASGRAEVATPGSPPAPGVEIRSTDAALYPFVRVVLRTSGARGEPLEGLGERAVQLAVEGRRYDAAKGQYRVEALRDRPEPIDSVLVLDARGALAGAPFEAARDAAVRFVAGKRPQDAVALLTTREVAAGFELVSDFERDPAVLEGRLRGLHADGKASQLFDAVGAALERASAASANGAGATAIVVFSDGFERGSALSREALGERIAALRSPIPIYAIAYSRVTSAHFDTLAALAASSSGVYQEAGESVGRMGRLAEGIQRVLQGDYLVTFRCYLPPDGQGHAFELGVESPGGGALGTASGRFEAVAATEVVAHRERLAALEALLPRRADGDPYGVSQ